MLYAPHLATGVQPWLFFVCRHPDECEVSVAHRFCFVYCLIMLAGRESGADNRESVAQRYPPTCVSVSCVMASRKPKGIDDQIIGGIRQIMSPWLGTPPAQNNKVTQAQGLARTAAQTLDQTFAGGMIGAGVQGNKALAKQAAVNVAALGTGYVAGKAMQTAVNSGIVSRAVRSVAGRNNTYFVHGSSTKGIKKLDPKYETMENTIASDPPLYERFPDGPPGPNDGVTYGFRLTELNKPNKLVPYKDLEERILDSAGYAKFNSRGSGSLYVAKTPKKFFEDELTSAKSKVIKEVDITGLSEKQIMDQMQTSLKKLGFKQPKRR